MKKIKIFITILYVVFAVEILGAWRHLPEARETTAYADTLNPQMAVEENTAAAAEIAARTEYAQVKAAERERQNEYYAVTNLEDEKERDRKLEEERRRKQRLREKRREERQILERIVEAEAGDQDIKGRILVVNVILNRVKSEKFPDSVKGVVFAHNQFSPIQNGSYYRVTVSEKTKQAVKKAMSGVDYSRGALYFMCRRASSPSNVSWFDRALTKVNEHGCHEFFR